MTRYAATTAVSSAKSRDEIERVLTRYGADAFIRIRGGTVKEIFGEKP